MLYAWNSIGSLGIVAIESSTFAMVRINFNDCLKARTNATPHTDKPETKIVHDHWPFFPIENKSDIVISKT